MIIRNVGFAATLACVLCNSVTAKECAPPAGFIDTPPPRIASLEDLATHTERVDVARSVRAVLDAANKPLKDQIQESSDLPGVGGSYMLTAGEFVYQPLGADRTRIHWTYSFQLNTDRFPGSMGGFGRFLFRKGFLEGDYANMMRGVLTSLKRRAETGVTN